MKKQITKKLTMNRETLRNLAEREVANAAAGASLVCTNSGDYTCVTCLKTKVDTCN